MRHVIFGLLLCGMAVAAPLSIIGHISDDAGLLSPAQRTELEALLDAHQRATTNQIAVVTVKSLNGRPISDFGYQLGREWGIGTKEKNNGVMLLVAPNEREVRIEVGYGLEGILTDAESKMIIENIIIPSFKRNEMGEGVVLGAKGIVAALGGELKAAPENQDDGLPVSPLFILCVIAFIIFSFFSRGGGRGSGWNSGSRGGTWWGGGRGGSSGGTSVGGGGSFGGGGASGKW